MDNDSKLEVHDKRLDGHSQDIHDLKNVCQNLVISMTQATEQIGVLQKIVYGGVALAVAQAAALILKK